MHSKLQLLHFLNPDTWQCNFDEFPCATQGRCIPLSWKCDGRTQCSQGNDEHDCHHSFCKNNEFQCVQQDTCIPLSWRCDGKSDCTNDEDEKLCGMSSFYENMIKLCNNTYILKHSS